MSKDEELSHRWKCKTCGWRTETKFSTPALLCFKCYVMQSPISDDKPMSIAEQVADPKHAVNEIKRLHVSWSKRSEMGTWRNGGTGT